MLYPPMADLLKHVNSRYLLVNVVARRARQMSIEATQNKTPLTEKPVTLAIREVADGKLSIDPSLCNNCGRCAAKCPFGVTDEGVEGYKVYIGGRWGKKCAKEKLLPKIYENEEEVLKKNKSLLYFRSLNY